MKLPRLLGAIGPEPAEPPICAEIFGIERLEQHARSLAKAQGVIEGIAPGRSLLSRVEENSRVLRRSNRAIAAILEEAGWIPPAAEWLIDNFYIIAEQLRQIRNDLSPGFYRGLPKLADGPLAGYPRVYGMAWAFVAHTDSRLDAEYLRRFVLAYQQVQPLTIGELWAVPIALRLVLIENLRRLADAMSEDRAAQREARDMAGALLGNAGNRGNAAAALARLSSGTGPLSPAFAVELIHRLHNRDSGAAAAQLELQRRLAAQNTTPVDVARVEHQREAASTATVRNVITSMRLIATLDWTKFFESVSLVDEALRTHGDYVSMDFVSRNNYRRAVETLAAGSGWSEVEVARKVLSRARGAARQSTDPVDQAEARLRDPGFYLVGGGRRAFEQEIGFHARMRLRLTRAFVDTAVPGFLGTLLVFTLVILAVPLALTLTSGLPNAALVLLGLLALVPASDLAVALLNREVTAVVTPAPLSRFEWTGGIPLDCRTLVAVPTMLSGVDDVRRQVAQLEAHYLANPDPEVRFALVSDWADSPTEHRSDDQEILASVCAGVARLNTLYGQAPGGGDRFFVFHRKRTWNESESAWMGWERKRGKLRELNRLLRGATDTTFLPLPDGQRVPEGVRYVLTLDRDTRMPAGVVKRLVGTMAHPLNRPRIDPDTRRVVEGHALLQPRVTPILPSRTGSRFQRLKSGSVGIDPYAAAVSDVYQDLFEEGSYTGKGIYHLDAFEAVMKGRVPENALLSHDLFEGLFARAGLVTDVELFEDVPADYLSHSARQHRWARGDWQLLPWILHHPFSAVDRWKMIDNLRRTLSMPTAFLTVSVAWLLPAALPLVWTAFVIATLAIPLLMPVVAGVLPRRRGVSLRMHLQMVGRDVGAAVAQTALSLATMPHQAWLMADAIIRTLTRLYVSRRRLLEWTPMALAAQNTSLTLGSFHRRMAGGIVLTSLAAAAVAWHGTAWSIELATIPLWALAPTICFLVSRPAVGDPSADLSPDDVRLLRSIARRTWGYFTAFVTPESHALPPDNFQDDPEPTVAQRTSPTNIGLYLLSAISARDFGWIGTLELVDRLEATLHTIKGLDGHRGHLFNWYDTATAQPLEPRYVSSVDSGNLAAALLTVSQACREVLERPLAPPDGLAGIEDAALILRSAVASAAGDLPNDSSGRVRDAVELTVRLTREPPGDPVEWAARLAELGSAAVSVTNLVQALEGRPATGQSEAVQQATEALSSSIRTLDRDVELLPWSRWSIVAKVGPMMASLTDAVPVAELPEHCRSMAHEISARRSELNAAIKTSHGVDRLDTLVEALDRSAAATAELVERVTRVAEDAESLATAMDFAFLFDPHRMLFAIGYRMSDECLDEGRYDLLASEARLLSFIAIAKGDVPAKHWFRLGRPMAPIGTGAALLSWSGSMFEYLMPQLLMRSPRRGLIDESNRRLVQQQIAYGAERNAPWGVSEAGYYARDLELAFQYSSFGIPGLGLRQGLAGDLVIAPYATGLAAMIRPKAAARNFRALIEAGADGRYGLIESIDYTAKRLPTGDAKALVSMYMAHHQGMLVVAMGNLFHAGAMRARFHAVPMIRASELLLQEPVPRDISLVRPAASPAPSRRDVREPVLPHARRFVTPHAPTPQAHLLSNGRYSVMLTASGSGYSQRNDMAVTRWLADSTRDAAGSYVYLRDVDTGERWSAGFQPTGQAPESYEVSFSVDRAEFHRRDGAIETRLEVLVSSEDDAEVRRVSITNHGTRAREVDVTSYAEVVLGPQAADTSHPAFSNLFVQTEVIPESGTLLATRRRRSPADPEIWLAHLLAVEGQTVGNLEWETDRQRFLGRGRGVRDPWVEIESRPLSRTTGLVLDPIVSLRRRVRVRSGATVQLVFSTLLGPTREDVLDLADKYNDVTIFERAATMAWTHAMVQLHHLGIGRDEAQLFQTLVGPLLYGNRLLRAPDQVISRQSEGVSALWAHGISGDLPVVLVKIDDPDDIGIVRQLLRAREYWEAMCLAVDLVILNDRASSYMQDLQNDLESLVEAAPSLRSLNGAAPRGKAFIIRSDLITRQQCDVLESVARAVFSSRDGTLAAQLHGLLEDPGPTGSRPRRAPERTEWEPGASPPPDPLPSAPSDTLEFFNGLGGFAEDGREYRILLPPGEWTPAPWINVLANADFGCLVSEAGAGCAWSGNSQANRLTPWSNDPVTDPPSEMFYVRDEESGQIWSPTALPIREKDGRYEVRHGQGWSRFRYRAHGIGLDLIHFVPVADPLKVARLSIVNDSDRTRRLSVTAFHDWVLGESRSTSAPFVVTEVDDVTGAVLARNPRNAEFGTRIAFADLVGAQDSWTGDRAEFLGSNGALDRPAALDSGERLSGRCGPALDPCCALQTTLVLAAGEQSEVVLLLGQAGTRQEARELVQRYRAADLDGCVREVARRWDRVLDTVRVATPDRALDLMLNRWLLYQTLACRVWARTALYQSSGAYGFRDQLQDVMALVLSCPDVARGHLLRSAARQFVEGDVQHWWHEPSGRGIRTRMSDDLLWLPYSTGHYLAVTGDESLLDETVPFLAGQQLEPDQMEAYFEPRASNELGTLFEHCARALDRSLTVGSHGLPLMGSGDWNDGMNRVGAAGRGESVWLAWFLSATLDAWIPIARSRGESKRAETWSRHRAALSRAVEDSAWDGAWYRRAYFDDGTPLGAAGADACVIDSIAQTWSVLSGAGDTDRARKGMAALDRKLVRREDGLVLLLTPPFDGTGMDVGYIESYPPGVRENGGQYTHAATWAVIAFAMLGDGARAGELMSMLNPVTHAATPADVKRYRVEPYVLAGDVYGEPPHVGRGGWTWYTGSAGWLYTAGIEWLLGVRVRNGRLFVDPCLPPSWPGASVQLRHGRAEYHIEIVNTGGAGRSVMAVEVDGTPVSPSSGILLADDGRSHRVRVVLGSGADRPEQDRQSPST